MSIKCRTGSNSKRTQRENGGVAKAREKECKRNAKTKVGNGEQQKVSITFEPSGHSGINTNGLGSIAGASLGHLAVMEMVERYGLDTVYLIPDFLSICVSLHTSLSFRSHTERSKSAIAL